MPVFSGPTSYRMYESLQAETIPIYIWWSVRFCSPCPCLNPDPRVWAWHHWRASQDQLGGRSASTLHSSCEAAPCLRPSSRPPLQRSAPASVEIRLHSVLSLLEW